MRFFLHIRKFYCTFAPEIAFQIIKKLESAYLEIVYT